MTTPLTLEDLLSRIESLERRLARLEGQRDLILDTDTGEIKPVKHYGLVYPDAPPIDADTGVPHLMPHPPHLPHSPDCAQNNAPAMEPKPCDCDFSGFDRTA